MTKLGQKEEALVALKKAVELDPRNGTFHLNLAVALRRQKKTDDAIKEYERAVALDPRLSGGFYDLGVLYAADRRYQDALDAFRKYTASGDRLDPESRKDAEARIKSLESSGKAK